METKLFDMKDTDIAWCPGCGNFAILTALKGALTELGIQPEKLVVVSGIGQAAKAPHYYKCNLFNGLHGRSLPAATAIKAANPELTVIDESGDGCMYGEGGNHFVHAIRRNPDITNLVHNNMVYALTKGQASPTSLRGFRTPVQTEGVFSEPFNPLACYNGVRVKGSRYYTRDACLYNSLSAGRCLSKMVAGLQGHIERCAPGFITRFLQCIDLGMGFACLGMEAPAYNVAVFHNYGPDTWVRCGPADCLPC